jgi:lactoylglutathione lyase
MQRATRLASAQESERFRGFVFSTKLRDLRVPHRKGAIMSRIRHIAIIVPDAEEAAKFYEQALGLKRAGKARRGIYLSDGVINIALLTKEHENEKLGLYHFGVWVDDLDASEKKVVDAGGTYLAGRPTSPNSFYEAKYRDPNGVVFDLTHQGWAGAAKDVVAKP